MQQSVVGVFLIKDVPQATGISLNEFLDCSIAQLCLSSLHMDFNSLEFPLVVCDKHLQEAEMTQLKDTW